MYWQNKQLFDLSEVIDGVLHVEKWRPLKGLSRYLFSSFGRVKNVEKNKIMSQHTDRRGYARVGLVRDVDGKYCFVVHQLIARAFIDNPLQKLEVNHIKGIKTDNRIHQIEWNTRSENRTHALRTGLCPMPIGERNGCSSLTNAQALAIFNSDENRLVLAARYGVNRNTIDRIKSGELWSGVTGKEYKRREITNEQALKIFNCKLSVRQCAIKFGVSERNVYDIKKGVSFSKVTGQVYVNKYKFPTKEEKDKIRKSNLSIKELAIKFNRSQGTIKRIKEANYEK